MKIILEGLEFKGKHGVLEVEKQTPQRFIVDAEIYADIEKSCLSDDLNDTVNYADLYEIIREIIENHSYNLIECLTYVIIDAIFNYSPKIEKIKICLKKPEAPLRGKFKWAAVEIDRTRET